MEEIAERFEELEQEAAFMVIALLGTNLTFAAAGSNEGLLRFLGYLGSALGLGGVGTFVILVVLGFDDGGARRRAESFGIRPGSPIYELIG